MFGLDLIDGLKIGAGAVLGALLMAAPVYLYGKSAGKTEVRLEAHVEALERTEEMENRNADFKKLPNIERCRVIMRDSGLSDNICVERFGLSNGEVH